MAILSTVASDRLIARRYQVVRRLGAGGMGEVYLCTDMELRRTVALKRSHTGDSGQIRREARLGAGLTHPHIVSVFDVVADDEDRWLVMEYVPSQALDGVLKSSGPLPPEQIRTVGAQLADALAAMHALGMVHRDIKPGNVLITEDGSARLTDLGVARWTEATITGGAVDAGTTAYLAPEVADGQPAEPPADVFGLGATLYAAATGRSPWGDSEQGPYAQLRRAADYKLEPLTAVVPDDLANDIGALLTRDPAERPTAEQARDLFLGSTSGQTDHTSVRSTTTASTTTARRRRTPWILAAVAAVVALVVVAAVLVNRDGDESAKSPGDDEKSSEAPVAGAIGDPHSADPCALLKPDSLRNYGTVTVEPNYGNFHHCDLIVDTSGEGDIVDVSLEFEPHEESSAQATVGPVEAEAPTENLCRRVINLPDDARVVVAARQVNEEPAPLCEMAEAAALAAYGSLVQEPVPRRKHKFEASSVANLDACDLLTSDEVRAALGDTPPPEPGFADWSCAWGGDEKEIWLTFRREWPLADDPLPGTRTRIGGRVAYVSDDDDMCHVAFAERRYTPAAASPDGSPTERDEVIDISLVDPDIDDPEKLCPAVTKLAKGLVSRLPS